MESPAKQPQNQQDKLPRKVQSQPIKPNQEGTADGTPSKTKIELPKPSECQLSSHQSITQNLPLTAKEQHAEVNLRNEEDEDGLVNDANHLQLVAQKVKNKLLHQNTGFLNDKPFQRGLIDDLVDEKQTSKPVSPANQFARMKQLESATKKSADNSKSHFVLETNKSVHSSRSLEHRSDSNLNLSNQSSNSTQSRNQNPFTIKSLSKKFNNANQIENRTLLAVLGDNEFVPEAMPIYRRISCLNEREPEFWAKYRNRHKNVQQQQQNDFKEACLHEEIINWKCKECHTNISKFELIYDDNEGKVQTQTKIVYENSFLDDFRIDFISQYNQMIQAVAEKKPPASYIIYNAYQPANVAELREYMFYLMSKYIKKKQKNNEDYVSPFGDGTFKNLSPKLCKYIMTNDDKQKNFMKNGNLWFDSIFESGNLLQAQRSLTEPNTYNLFMQVDTNTRGHQQWFYFRVKGGEKNKEYTFKIMNFTKPGVTGGRGYKSNEYEMRIHFKSKQREKATNSDTWQYLTHETCQCEYKKTNIARRKKDVIAAGADSDQEDWVEEAFQNQPINSQGKPVDFGVQIPDSTPSLNRLDTGGNREKTKKRRVFYYYALQFKYKFEFDNDTVYFSFAKPITYSEILEDIHNKERSLMPKNSMGQDGAGESPQKLNLITPKKQSNHRGGKTYYSRNERYDKEDPLDPGPSVKINPPELLKNNRFQQNLIVDNPQKLLYYQRTEMCRTLTGIPLYKIVISRDLKCQKKNQIVLITSRVHAGETPGSEVFKGIFDFITSDCREARYLRRFYTFVLVPCMNPDGVICGNYRNSVAGVDLNRQWINPEPIFHQEVVCVKNFMQQIKDEQKRQIWIFCDIHGHSKKKNSFFYGCNTAANGGFLSWTIVRLLPRILAQKTHMFNYKDSRFRVESYKIGTARVVAWKQFHITHSFTLENSFFGYEVGEGESKCFTQEDYKDIGLKFTMAIYDMHFLWKDIKRELRITQGWLKPRTLYELTGVPLAQKLAEEAAAIKEQQRKQNAIQQYEEYLRTYYNTKTSPIKRHPTFVSRVNYQQQLRPEKTRNSLSNPKMLSEEIGARDHKNRHGMMNKKILESGNLNEDLEEAMKQDHTEEDIYYRLHRGLVKIQACFRGYLARRKFARMIRRPSRTSRLMTTNQDNVKNNFYEVGSDNGKGKQAAIQGEEVFMRSNTDHFGKKSNNHVPSEFHFDMLSQDTTTQNLSIFGGKTFNRPKLDWREFFHNDELDKAYQIVEVEQRDESDNSESMGSESNPSEDNLEEEEIYEKVYGIRNPQLLIQTRQKKYEQFVQRMQGMNEKSLPDIHDQFRPKPREILSESKGVLKDKEIAERKFKSAYRGRSEKNVFQTKVLNQNSNDDDSQQFTPMSKEDNRNQLILNSSQKNFIRKNWQQNIMNRSSQSPIINKDITQESAFPSNAPVPLNPVRMIQQSYLKQQNSHKKENINQVIKDCFITKKMNTKSAHQNSNNMFSKQGQQWAPYQNNAAGNKTMTSGFGSGSQQPGQKKSSLKAQGHSVSQQQQSYKLYSSSNKKQQIHKPMIQIDRHQQRTDLIGIRDGNGCFKYYMAPSFDLDSQGEMQFHNFQDQQLDDNSMMMNQQFEGIQMPPLLQFMVPYHQIMHKPMTQQISRQQERDPIKLRNKQQIGTTQSQASESYPIMNSYNQIEIPFDQKQEMIAYGPDGDFSLNAYPVRFSDSSNNLRGINSISVMQNDPNYAHQKLTPNYESQDYRPGTLKLAQHQNQYIVQSSQTGIQKGQSKTDSIKKNKNQKHLAKVNPRTFMVTSGLITDHKEGLNSLFVTGKSEPSIPTSIQGGKSKHNNSQQQQQQQQAANLQSVRHLVEQILLGPVKLDQQQIEYQIQNNQMKEGGVQQFVNINQFNMIYSQSRDNNANNMKAMVQSSDGSLLLPNNNIVVSNKYHHHSSKQQAKSQGRSVHQPFSQQQAAQIQSLQLQQPRGALHMQHHIPASLIQHTAVQQHHLKPGAIHNKFGYGIPKVSKINKLEAVDKIPVGLQSLLDKIPAQKPPVSAVSRHTTNMMAGQQQNLQKHTHPKRVLK